VNIAYQQQEETPEFYRRRYEELKAQAAATNARRLTPFASANPPILPVSLIVMEETIPGLWYWTLRLARGQSLRIINDFATPGVSVFLWNADDPSERYNAPDTVKVQWTARLTRGKLMLSDMGRVLASITADTCGAHDSIAGGSTPESNLRRYGVSDLRNTRDNFILAASKHGLGARDIAACTTFFAPVQVNQYGGIEWRDDVVEPGDFVDLRAEMNLIVALSNCPHPMAPGQIPEAHPVRAIIWRSPAATSDDFCRTASKEAERAFQNTDSAQQK
jgi:urea carboxylase-associated protein 2